MTIYKLPIQLAVLLFSLIISSAVTAEESNKNENKNYRPCHTVGDADIVDRAGSDTESVVEKQAATIETPAALAQNNPIIGADDFQQIEKQWHRRRQEAYRQHLLNRQRQMNANPALPKDVQTRRNKYIKHMEQRRELFNKMNEQQRQKVEQRREKMRQKMHQTRTNTAASGSS